MREVERNYGYTRNNSYLNRYTSKKSKTRKGMGKFDKKTVERLVNQLIVSAVICLVIIIISNFQGALINKLMGGIGWVVGSNYDFKNAAATVRSSFVPGFDNKLEDVSGTVNGLFGKTDAVDVSASNVSVMIMPVDGKITSGFGRREDPISHKMAEHYGIDIAGEKGTPIKAAMDGVVVKIEENKTMGRAVTLKHSGGLETLYGHCSEILVDEDQNVKQGDYIAKVGDTGEVTSAHLHFEVRQDGKAIDPLSIFEGVKEPK